MELLTFVVCWMNAADASQVAQTLGLTRKETFELANRARGLGHDLKELAWEMLWLDAVHELYARYTTADIILADMKKAYRFVRTWCYSRSVTEVAARLCLHPEVARLVADELRRAGVHLPKKPVTHDAAVN